MQCPGCGIESKATVKLCRCGYSQGKLSKSTAKVQEGPGTELEKLIPGVFKTGGCGCQAYRDQMNRWGVTECRERRTEIIDYLQSQAARWKVPGFVSRPVLGVMIDKAIKACDG